MDGKFYTSAGVSRCRLLGQRGVDSRNLFPSFIFVLLGAPLPVRHGSNPNVRGFVRSAYILLDGIAIGDRLTDLIGVVSLAVLFRRKVNNALLIAATTVIGLIAYPILQPDWVIVKYSAAQLLHSGATLILNKHTR